MKNIIIIGACRSGKTEEILRMAIKAHIESDFPVAIHNVFFKDESQDLNMAPVRIAFEHLNQSIKICNEVIREFKAPMLYNEPSKFIHKPKNNFRKR